MLSLLLQLLVVAAVLSLAWWALSSMPLPQPLRIVFTVLFAIIGIVIVLRTSGVWTGGGLRLG